MKKTSYLYIGSIVLGMLVSNYACNEYLDVETNNQLAIEDFYKTDDDANQAVLAAYSTLRWHVNIWGSNWSSPYMIKTLPSDEGQAGGSSSGDQPNYVALDRLTFDSTNGAIAGVWGINYYGIYRANLVIANVAPDTEIKIRSIAEAKALRAYYYFELVSMFGDVPLILEPLTSENYDQSRVDKAQVYAQIQKDLEEAMANLPLKSAYSQADRFRMSKGTAQAILGKAYVYQEKWGEAAAAFDELIASNEYNLEADFGTVFTQEGELGVESIMEAIYISTAGYDWGANGYPWGARAESNVHIQLMGAREANFSGVDSLNNGWGFNYPSEKMWNAFIEAGDTERRQHTLMSEEEFVADGGEITDPDQAFDYEGYLRRKYGAYSGETIEDLGVPQINYGTNWRLIRYADILLLAAEAHYQAGNEGQALTELNKVRTRAQLPTISTGGDALFEAIVTERQLELAFEGHRYLDLIRWGLAADEIEGFQSGKHELYPIPQGEVLSSSVTQNPGY